MVTDKPVLATNCSLPNVAFLLSMLLFQARNPGIPAGVSKITNRELFLNTRPAPAVD